MRLNRVSSYKTPKFPTQTDILRDRTLLDVMPKRWQTNPVVLTAVSSLCAISLTACSVPKADKASLATSSPTQTPTPKKTSEKVIVAPIFRHGSGYYNQFALTGITTTDSIKKLITESQMEDIIISEAKRLGVNLTKNTVNVGNVSTPITSTHSTLKDDVNKVKFHKPASFALDLVSENGAIGVEYVSQIDYYDWQKPVKANTDNYYETSPYVAAKMLAKKGMVNAKSDTMKAIGILYDPIKEETDALVKLQVRDFINWLKGQGLV